MDTEKTWYPSTGLPKIMLTRDILFVPYVPVGQLRGSENRKGRRENARWQHFQCFPESQRFVSNSTGHPGPSFVNKLWFSLSLSTKCKNGYP